MGGPIAYLKAHPEKSFNVEKSDEFLTRLGHSRANPVCVFIAFFQDTKKEKRAKSSSRCVSASGERVFMSSKNARELSVDENAVSLTFWVILGRHLHP